MNKKTQWEFYIIFYLIISILVLSFFTGIILKRLYPDNLILKIGFLLIGTSILWKAYNAIRTRKIPFVLEDVHFKNNPKIFIFISIINTLVGIAMISTVLLSII